MVSQFFDRARKDFWEMFIHHLVTLILIFFSWTANLVRIGTSVLLLHDMADIMLEVNVLNLNFLSLSQIRLYADADSIIFYISGRKNGELCQENDSWEYLLRSIHHDLVLYTVIPLSSSYSQKVSKIRVLDKASPIDFKASGIK